MTERGPFLDDAAALPEAVATLPPSDILLGYQRGTIKLTHENSLTVVEKSRRIGLTWGLASDATLTASASRQAGGMKAWYMGYDLEMAREFIDVCGMWAGAFQIAASAADEVVLADPEGDIKAFRISFPSGFEVVALPSVARALRGKQGLVIIDEAAFHKNLVEVLKAAIALLMWGGRVVVVSTHDGLDNPFNQLIDEIRAGRRKGAVKTITFDDALGDGLYERVALVTRAKGQEPPSKEEWIANIRATYGDDASEELDCIPKAGSGSWIAAEDISACEHPDAGKEDLYQGGLVYIGYDVARRRDLAVIWAFELVKGTLWLRSRWEARGAKFAEHNNELGRLFNIEPKVKTPSWATRKVMPYRVAACRIDQTGMGEKVVEDAQHDYGATRVQGILFTGPNRLDLATLLRDRFEAGTIRIPPDPAIRTDLRALKRAGPGGKALVEAGEVHPDMFWAAGLACEGARMPPGDFAYHTIPRSNPLGGRADVDDEDDGANRKGWEREGEGDGSMRRGLSRGATW